MPLLSSTTLAVGLFAAVTAGFVAGVAYARRMLREPFTPAELRELKYLRRSAVRLACAQHWARAGVLSKPDETWRPICTSLAIAALALDDDADLAQLLGVHVGQLGVDPELVNVWRQARGELINAREGLNFDFLSGLDQHGQPTWDLPRLRGEAERCLDAAHQAAEALLVIRRSGMANS